MAQRAPLADAEEHVHLLGGDTLELADRLAVEAELHHVGRLLGSRKLGVHRLVAPGAERGRAIDSLEEVGPAAPVAVHERCLVDDLGAGAHGLHGRACPGLEVPGVRRDDLDDLPPLLPESGQVRRLVLLPFAAQQLVLLAGKVGARTRAPGDVERQPREMRALDVVVQIRGREGQAAVQELHGAGAS